MIFLKTDLANRVKNTSHFRTEALLPVFEAIVNSIQAIEERGNHKAGLVSIRIIRDDQKMLGDFETPSITAFEVTDNGVGFNERNFESFQTSDSTHKADFGGKGVGRFLWLKAFDKVVIESAYKNGSGLEQRNFHFNLNDGIKEFNMKRTISDSGTTVKLIGFKREYRDLPTAYKTTSKIAQRILEHCLAYFICQAVPRITITDGDETISLNGQYEHEIRNQIKEQSIIIKSKAFHLVHVKLHSTHAQMHKIVLCANKRDVKAINLAKTLGAGTQFDDEGRKFTYALYVSGDFLDERVDHQRLDFDISDEQSFLDTSETISFSNIINALSDQAKAHLKSYLERANQLKIVNVEKFIENESPWLRSVPHYCPEVYEDLTPNSTNEEIHAALYRHKGRAELALKKRSEKFLGTQTKSLKEMTEIYEDLASTVTQQQKDNLTRYICDRKCIIDLLEKKLEIENGSYAKEKVLHDIVFPRNRSSNEIRHEDHNLWLIDEVLSFHRFATSDKPLRSILKSDTSDRPDILSFAEVDDDQIARCVSIIEFKKPQRRNFDEDPTGQMYRYLRQIRDA
ncbi:MAG: ATP-binding protein, partial [Planctomycetota bacterium]|nr:ATP-binding protein [Planctomycetota bacterium]